MLYRIVILLTVALPVFGQPLLHHGPYDVYYAQDLAVTDNGRIFLSATGGVYYSDDAGGNWTFLNHFMNSIYFHPEFTVDEKTNRLFAWDRFHGIFYTNNNGVSWDQKLVINAPDDAMILALAVHGDSIFYGTEKGLKVVRGASQFLYPEIISFFDSKEITSIHFRGKEVFCGTASNGFYFSSNGGSTWEGRSNGLPAGFVVDGIAGTEEIMFVYSQFDGIYYSTNKGLTWLPKNSGLLSLQISDLFIDGDRIIATTFGYNNVYSSSLSGQSWTRFEGTFPAKMAIETIAVVNGTLVGGGWHSVIKSEDNGSNWFESYKGVSDAFEIRTIEKSPDGTLWATGTHTGVYQMKAGESLFSHFATDGTNYGSPRLISDSLVVIDYQKLKFYDTGAKTWQGDIEFVGIHFPDRLVRTNDGLFLSSYTQGVFKYAGIATWQPWNTGLTSLRTVDFIYSKGTYYLATEDGFYTMDHSEAVWKKANFGNESGVRAFLVKDDLIILSTSDYKCYKSTDGGLNWKRIEGLASGGAEAFALHENKIFAASFQKISISDDQGETWLQGPNPVGFVSALAVHNGLLYIASRERGIWSSGLKLNQEISFGSLSTEVMVNDVIPMTPTASSGLPVSVSIVSGDALIKDNMLHVNGDGIIAIRAWQGGNEVFNEVAVELILIASGVTSADDSDHPLLSVYPNPASGFLKVAAQGELKDGAAELINSKGEKVFHGSIAAMDGEALDVSGLPRGMYVLLCRKSGRIVARKIMLR